MKRPIFPG